MMKVSSASPASVTPGTTVHSGYLNKLSGRAFLYPGSWKKKYCVLDSQRLFFFNSKEDEAACVANPERISSYINLEYYDSCEEAAAKEVRKASNVFVVSSSDKSFFESGRYYFSAETLPEMNEWINQIRLVMESLRTKGSPLVKQTVKKTTANPPPAAVVNKETNKDVPSIKEETTVPASDDYVTPDLEEVTSGAERLDCMTRQRAKGPAGRRLPRQRFTTVDGSPALNGREQRSGSLSLLDSEEAEQNRSGQGQDQGQGQSQDHEELESPVCTTSADLARFDRAWFLSYRRMTQAPLPVGSIPVSPSQPQEQPVQQETLAVQKNETEKETAEPLVRNRNWWRDWICTVQ